MKFTFIQIVELKVAVEQRIDMLEQRTEGVSEKDMPYSHKALADQRECLGVVQQAIVVGDYIL